MVFAMIDDAAYGPKQKLLRQYGVKKLLTPLQAMKVAEAGRFTPALKQDVLKAPSFEEVLRGERGHIGLEGLLDELVDLYLDLDDCAKRFCGSGAGRDFLDICWGLAERLPVRPKKNTLDKLRGNTDANHKWQMFFIIGAAAMAADAPLTPVYLELLDRHHLFT